jgi:ribosomal peptide maturation radical SAM protein 1
LTEAGCDVVCSHLHLEIAETFGSERYSRIAGGWELGEALYFSLYAGDEAEEILGETARALRSRGDPDDLCTLEVAGELARATSAALERLDIDSFDLIGISVGAIQLGAACYLSDLIRRAAPLVRLVLGGSALVGTVSTELLAQLTSVNVIIDGEGEIALAALARESEWTPKILAEIPNIVYRDGNGSIVRGTCATPVSLGRSTVPDFEEYFAFLRAVDAPETEAVLPVEASRGCAWEHRRGDGQLRGCTFCGLYRGSPDFREKPMSRVVAEIVEAASKYGILEVSFTDAYLPPSYAKELLNDLIDADIDISLFCEMRCDFDGEMADLLVRANARQIQLGVEAFSTPILRRMAKGTRLIDNVRALKLCAARGVPVQYNLLSHFPGVHADDVYRMLDLLPHLFGFTAPTVARFYLDRGSRIYADPERFGLAREDFDREALSFLPQTMTAARISQVVTVSGTGDPRANAAWDGLEGIIARWSESQARAAELGLLTGGLSWRDTGREMIITDARGAVPRVIRLSGISRQLMRMADDLTTTRSLLAAVPIGSDRLESALAALEELGLVLREGAFVISLPVRARLTVGVSRSTGTSLSASEKAVEFAR